jgi:phosphohistidine phosphatase
MKRLIVMRHATTEGSSPGGDVERALTPEGIDEAARVGRWLSASGHVPDLALCSTARRVRETWAEVSRAFSAPVSVRFDPAIYVASAGDLMLEVSEVGEGVDTLMLVGHNPSVSHFALDLVRNADPDGRDRLRTGFRPSTVAVFEVAATAFEALPTAGARLVERVASGDL